MNPIGEPLDRIDGRLKVTGGALFAADHAPACTAFGVVVTSTIAAGTLRTIDASAASAAPGVIAVFTNNNFPSLRPIEGDDTEPGERRSPILGETIYYSGQPIALLVAESFEQATWAASLVTATYDEQRPRVLMSGHDSERKMYGKPFVRGDADAALSAAPLTVDNVYRTPVIHHCMIEPHAIVAIWEGSQLTLHDSSQYIFGSRASVAKAFGLSLEDVRVLSPFVGGGFGCKSSTWPHVLLAVAAAHLVQRPVKIVLTREQTFTISGHRPETEQRLALGANSVGKLTSIVHESVNHTAMFQDFLEGCPAITEMMYASPAIRTRRNTVAVNHPQPTYMRAPGETPGSFALESAMDELSYALNLDPVELRLINHADVDPRDGRPWSSKSLKECYARAGQRFGWASRNSEPRSMRDGRLLVGWGMASATRPTYRNATSARVRISADGSALVQCGAQEMGMGTSTVHTQLAAELLGLRVERLRFELGDTRLPFADVAGGSAQTASVGSAVKGACDAVIARIAELAVGDERSALHGAPTDRITLADGKVLLRSAASPAESLVDLLRRNKRWFIEAEYDARPAASGYSSHAFGAHFVEVKIDPDVAEIRVARVISAFAAGRILNAKTARSQYIGGIVQGIGMALMERTRIDELLGRYVNMSLSDYLLPVHADVTIIEPILVEEHEAHANPIGVKGIGEIGIVGVAPAIANAVYHATGKRVRDLPITIEKLM